MDNQPFPFPSDRAQKWIEQEMELAQNVYGAFAKGSWRSTKGTPLTIIREVLATNLPECYNDQMRGENLVGVLTTRRNVCVGDVDLRHAYWWKERLTPIKPHWEDSRDKEQIRCIGGKYSIHIVYISCLRIALLNLIPFYSGAQVIVTQPWNWLRYNDHYLLPVGYSSYWFYRSTSRNLYLQRWFKSYPYLGKVGFCAFRITWGNRHSFQGKAFGRELQGAEGLFIDLDYTLKFGADRIYSCQ
ncbi:hypothetical protein F5879DRAFT_264869 [Lentinula edodes]|nr:hypothetical protein F5879DRAFT_264869 [Lentinula edodes]